ncbi:hypothetical protein AAHA92_24924 [Salvia divinorum]|uniref:At1g61320/AtMIF1 LRR domain-containing protein n=1 Tax=Salvia divinorum TaxID=28513 RepID=A0ABD1GC40_SALDI
MVDCVLNLHRGGRIKELEVDMFGHDGGNFERWFEFAMTKKVERIHIVMHYDSPFVRLPYTITSHGLECLKDLYLSHIQMTDQDFELLVSNCVALERLTLRLSFKLEHVSIVGLSKLKHLNLFYLLGARSLVIRDAINLVSLTIHELGRGCTVQLCNTPNLTKLDFKERFDRLSHVDLLDGMPSCIRNQLRSLRLSTRVYSFDQVMHHAVLSVKLVNIKQLELMVDIRDDHRDIAYSQYVCRLVEACSSLKKLVIKFPQRPTGYLGSLSEQDLALYVIREARAPEKLVVVPCDGEALARAHSDIEHITSVSFLVL